MSVPRHLVTAPSVTPNRFGLFSVAQPRTDTVDDPDHWRNGIQWVSQNCHSDELFFPDCDGNDTLDSEQLCSVREFDPFAVYAYNTDPVPGFTLPEHEANTTARLLATEQTLVEWETWLAFGAEINNNEFGCYDTANLPGWIALGYAEQVANGLFAGSGVIHMSRTAATALGLYLTVEGSTLRTKLGTPVVAGAGYGFFDPDGIATLVVTGPMVMYRGDVDTRLQAIDKATNRVSYVAQREYVIGWDCGAYCFTANICTPPECDIEPN